MQTIAEILIVACLVASGIFGLVGSFGLIKLTDAMSRLHAPTKATTLGVGGILIASLLNAWFIIGVGSAHELLITIFLLLTAPVTALFIAKSHLHRNIDSKELPDSGDDTTWAVLNTDAPNTAPKPTGPDG